MAERESGVWPLRWLKPGLPGALKFRYCIAMASVALVYIAMNSVYFILADKPGLMYVVLPENLLLLVILNVIIASRIYAPISRFMRTRDNALEAREALAHLPLRSAAWVGLLTVGYCALLFMSGTFTPDAADIQRIPEWNRAFALIWFSFVYAVYYSFYVFFSDRQRRHKPARHTVSRLWSGD